MRYRSFEDRKVSTFVAIGIITLFGVGATTLILHTLSKVKFTETELAKIVD